jgi:DNA glycosylase AlkZ-like
VPLRERDILRARLASQGLMTGRRGSPAALAGWFGAIQAQEYAPATWSIAIRLAQPSSAADVEAAIAGGSILRTHVLRPTWHFVGRDDLRWLQALTAPRVLAMMRPYDLRNGIDAPLVARSTRIIAAAIAKRGHLTRKEIAAVLAGAGIAVNSWRVGELLMHAELGAVVCSGCPRGRQQTYALVDEIAPRIVSMARDEALATLAARYFQSHGPATARDFRWWSGLNAAEASRALEMLGRGFARVRCGDRDYVMPAGVPPAARRERPSAHLIPTYDELLVAYSESRDIVDAVGGARRRKWGLLLRGVIVDGELVGRWNRESPQGPLRLELLRRLTPAERAAVAAAAARFERFISPDADRTDSGPNQSRSRRSRFLLS